MDEDRPRKKRREEKVHFPARGWYNTIILSESGSEHKENASNKYTENGGLTYAAQGAHP